jgi:hypothetical protein
LPSITSYGTIIIGGVLLGISKQNTFIEQVDKYIMIIERGSEQYEVKIDKDDYERVKEYKWSLGKDNYAVSSTCYRKNKTQYLHQFIMGKKENYLIDHIDRNKSNNKKNNLRYVTRQINAINNNAKGISYNKNEHKWTAYIIINSIKKHLGYFVDKQDALKARQNAEQIYFTPKIMEVSING